MFLSRPLLAVALSACGISDPAASTPTTLSTTAATTSAGAGPSSIPSSTPCTPQLVYLDQDGDGFGDPNTTQETCEPGKGWTAQAGDCDDTNDAVNPDAHDSPCDAIDADCSGEAAQGAAADGLRVYATAQLAIESAGAGDVVEICPGEHDVAATRLELTGLTVRSYSGSPEDTVFLQPEDTVADILRVSGDFTVEGIGFDGVQSDHAVVIEASAGVQSITLRNCVFDDFYENVVEAEGDTQLVVEDCLFLEPSRNALALHALTDKASVTIRGSLFSGSSSGFVHPLLLASGSFPTLTIQGCEFRDNWRALNTLLHIWRPDDRPIDVLIEDTIIEDNRATDDIYPSGLVHFEGLGPGDGGTLASTLTVRGGRIHNNEIDLGAALYVPPESEHISVTLEGVDFGSNHGDELAYLGVPYALEGVVDLVCEGAAGCR
jgi:hypothetical protein